MFPCLHVFQGYAWPIKASSTSKEEVSNRAGAIASLIKLLQAM